ncbi:MAG: hypothetical protein HRT68_04220 [Flavobacteriaceae bacterium]|nr:hypothetical protein [Flavobacteriaceae bacterium]
MKEVSYATYNPAGATIDIPDPDVSANGTVLFYLSDLFQLDKDSLYKEEKLKLLNLIITKEFFRRKATAIQFIHLL